MLVLSRKVGEKLIVTASNGEVIESVLCNVRLAYGGSARIGINAPKGVTVHRQEIADRIQRNASA